MFNRKIKLKHIKALSFSALTFLAFSAHTQASAGNDAAVVEFTGKVQHMAQVHQYGLKDRPIRNSHNVRYEARPLLGFSQNSRNNTEALILKLLSSLSNRRG